VVESARAHHARYGCSHQSNGNRATIRRMTHAPIWGTKSHKWVYRKTRWYRFTEPKRDGSSLRSQWWPRIYSKANLRWPWGGLITP